MDHQSRNPSSSNAIQDHQDLPASAGVVQVALSGAVLEVALGESISGATPSAPLICAAHPADVFGRDTAELLQAAAGARVACINPRGLGGSTPLSPGPRYLLEDMVDDLEAVRRRLGRAPWVFWGSQVVAGWGRSTRAGIPRAWPD